MVRTGPCSPALITNENPNETGRGITVKEDIDSISPIHSQSTGFDTDLVKTMRDIRNLLNTFCHHVDLRIVLVMRLHEGEMSLRATPNTTSRILNPSLLSHGRPWKGTLRRE